MGSAWTKRVGNTLPLRKSYNQKWQMACFFLANICARHFVACGNRLEVKNPMRAWVVEDFETGLSLTDVADPAPERGQVLLRVHATGLNFADLLMMKGTYQETPETPFSPGLEVAGTVVETGEGVTALSVGQRVAAVARHGGLAELCVPDASRCIALPESMDDVTAAGLQIAYGTSHLALTRRARLRSGEVMAVLGAAGGVGLTAVAIGKAMGAHVIALARGADRLAVAQAAGADVLIDTDEANDIRGALKA